MSITMLNTEEPVKLTEAEYTEAIESMLAISQLHVWQILALPIDTMLADARRANDIAPLVDPTLWIKGHKALESHIRLMEIFKQLRDFYVVTINDLTLDKGAIDAIIDPDPV